MLFLAADHAGFDLKEKLKEKLQSQKVEFEDLGTNSTESTDYPDYAKVLSERVSEDSSHRGLLLCGSGLGMAIAANKYRGIRAVSLSEPVSARLSREHNDANILCLGARIIGEEVAWSCLQAFLDSSFDEGHPRHQRRLDKISKIEK